MTEKGKLLGILQRVLPEDINAEISVLSESSAETQITLNSLADGCHRQSLLIHVKVEQEGRVGEYFGNSLTPAGLRKAVTNARANAAWGRPGPLILTGSTGYRDMTLAFPGTASQSPKKRAQLLEPVLAIASTINVNVDGTLTAQSGELAIVNTAGLVAMTAVTMASFQVYVTAEGAGQGFGFTCSRSAEDLDIMEPFLAAAAKCQAASNPQPLSGGKYTVILEPAAVADLLELAAGVVFCGRAFLEGRSPVSEIGQRIFGENINIWDDGLDPKGLAVPFDFQGVPKQRFNLVNRGAISNVALDNDTAALLKMAGTGHAARSGGPGPRPHHIFMEPGNAMLDDMIASTRRGILISRLRNLVMLEPRSSLVTGTTGSGTLLIEDGKLTSSLYNLRFAQNLVQILSQVEMIGDETLLFGDLWGGIRVPAMKVHGFSVLGSNIGQG